MCMLVMSSKTLPILQVFLLLSISPPLKFVKIDILIRVSLFSLFKMTEEEEEKCKKRKECNKEAAQRCRERKKEKQKNDEKVRERQTVGQLSKS